MTKEQCNDCPWLVSIRTSAGVIQVCAVWRETIDLVCRCGDRIYEAFLEPGD